MLPTWCFLAAVVTATMPAPSSASTHDLVDIPAPSAAGAFAHEFELDGRSVSLRLEANEEPFGHLQDSVLASIHAGGNRFFRGVLSGVDGSWVRLSWVDRRWSGAIFDGNELFILDAPHTPQTRSEGAGKAASAVALYRLSELELENIDLHDDREGSVEEPLLHGRAHPKLQAQAFGGDGRLPITIVSDTQFSSKHGGNALAVAASRINTVDGVLSAEVGTGLLLMHHERLTSNDTLTATNCFDLRQQFQDYFLDGNGSDIPFSGVAHLFTGRQLPGTVGCVTSTSFGPCTRAFSLGVVMDMPNEWQSIAVFAHELGHNLGAPHDAEAGSQCAHEGPGRIMAPNGGTSLTYSGCSVDVMQQRLETASCVVRLGVFRDGFETR